MNKRKHIISSDSFYLVKTIDVQNGVERSTIWTIFKAEGQHPIITSVSTLGLHFNHSAQVHKSNLKKVSHIKHVVQYQLVVRKCAAPGG